MQRIHYRVDLKVVTLQWGADLRPCSPYKTVNDKQRKIHHRKVYHITQGGKAFVICTSIYHNKMCLDDRSKKKVVMCLIDL